MDAQSFLRIAIRCILLLLVPLAYGQEPNETKNKRLQLEAAAGALVKQLAGGEFEEATLNFDETMSNVLKPAQLKTVWESITAAAGPFDQATHLRHQSVDVYQIVFVTCKFANASLDMKVVFDQRGQVTGLFFVPTTGGGEYKPPEYAKPGTFTETEVVIGAEPWRLPGTFSMPKGDTQLPAVILVHGSGPNDRDETIGANKPFKDLALGLASNGIAVLRYDKRTKTHGAELPKGLTVLEETIEDVIAAADWLAQQQSIDSSRVFVLGHSLGGYLAPRIDKADVEDRIAGYIIMAGNTRPLEDLIQEQTAYILGLDGEITDSDNDRIMEIERNVRKVKTLSADSEPGPVFGVAASYWLALDGYLPHEEAKAVAKPMLILQGERDYQVTMKDFANWKSALADRHDVRLKSYPGLNHLMMPGSEPSKPADYEVPGHVSSEVIGDLTEWIKQH